MLFNLFTSSVYSIPKFNEFLCHHLKQVAGALEMLLGAQGRKIRIVERYDDSFKMLSDFKHGDN